MQVRLDTLDETNVCTSDSNSIKKYRIIRHPMSPVREMWTLHEANVPRSSPSVFDEVSCRAVDCALCNHCVIDATEACDERLFLCLLWNGSYYVYCVSGSAERSSTLSIVSVWVNALLISLICWVVSSNDVCSRVPLSDVFNISTCVHTHQGVQTYAHIYRVGQMCTPTKVYRHIHIYSIVHQPRTHIYPHVHCTPTKVYTHIQMCTPTKVCRYIQIYSIVHRPRTHIHPHVCQPRCTHMHVCRDQGVHTSRCMHICSVCTPRCSPTKVYTHIRGYRHISMLSTSISCWLYCVNCSSVFLL